MRPGATAGVGGILRPLHRPSFFTQRTHLLQGLLHCIVEGPLLLVVGHHLCGICRQLLNAWRMR